MVNDSITKFMKGEWSVDDLIEATVDEMSMAGSAGSGTERPLGGAPSKMGKLVGFLKQAKRKGEDTTAVADHLLPGAPDETIRNLVRSAEDEEEGNS